VMCILNAVAEKIIDSACELGRIDAIAGDGDHGIGMERGVRAARRAAEKALRQGAGVGALLQCAADAWADEAGGTSGAIWGVILNTLGTSLGNEECPDAKGVAYAVAQASEGVMHFGKAKPGDKTLVDVLHPFSQALLEAAETHTLSVAWQLAAGVAQLSAENTAQLVPKIGRARPLAERSLGTPDAGAVSLAMVVMTVAEFMKQSCPTLQTQEGVCL
ncbi:DAK2 domain-containing protein, partial [Salmonella enterica subsp. enterica serovar Muenchen]|nr:DAK2 domain-containing protein [Salmonella enterica subsp. enterica serovar Muenchen]